MSEKFIECVSGKDAEIPRWTSDSCIFLFILGILFVKGDLILVYLCEDEVCCE